MNKKFVTLIFDIFGYSFVGILAYLFGLVLQNYNTGNKFLEDLARFNNNARDIIMAMVIQVLLILLFGHAYATAFLINNQSYPIENGVNVCSIVGHWLETVFVGIIVFVILDQILRLGILSVGFWIIFLSVALVYIFSSFFYRTLKNNEDSGQKTKARYILVCPTLLMICFNIYIGANILTLLEGEWVYYIPIALIFACLIWLYHVKDKYLLILSAVSGIIIISSGIMAILKTIPANVQLAMKNLFLAIMVSIFLSIFESWYITFRQMRHDNRRIYMRVSMLIVALMPPIVFFLYPIQHFNFCYCLTFWIGMFFTDCIAFYLILPLISTEETIDDHKKRKIAIYRAGLGILTLIFLIMDKYVTYMPEWENTEYDISTFLSFITLLITPLETLVVFFDFKKGESSGKTFKDWLDSCRGKTSEYMLIRGIASIFLIICRFLFYGFMNIDDTKAKLSSSFFCVFMFLSSLLAGFQWMISNKNINNKKDNS